MDVFGCSAMGIMWNLLACDHGIKEMETFALFGQENKRTYLQGQTKKALEKLFQQDQ